MKRFKLPTPESVRRGATDHWILCDSPAELAALPRGRNNSGLRASAAWKGGTRFDAERFARDGRLDLVAASDKLLTEFENAAELIVTSRSVRVHDVCGSSPDVPAFLSGSPLSMIRRKRDVSDRAPVCIIVDTTVSAAINHTTVQRRGAAVLAFVRLLSARRAVELWCGTGLDNVSGYPTGANYTFTRLDTSPLDLARAAFMLCDTAATRCLGYDACDDYTGAWPYKGGALSVEDFTAVARQAFPHLAEFVAVPGLHVTDPLVVDPVKWIAGKLDQFGETEEE